MDRDSSPDMVSYDPTTPARPIAVKTTSSRRPYGRSVAGPSKRSTNITTKRSNAKKSAQDSSSGAELQDHPERIEIPSGGEGQPHKPVTKAQGKKAAVRDAGPPPNGKALSKGKGKAKEAPLLEHQGRDNDPEDLMVVDVEDLTGIPDDDAFEQLNQPPKLNGVLKQTVRDADFRRAQRQLQQREKEVETLKNQVESLLQDRVEQESALEEWKMQFESGNETYKAYNRELRKMERSASSNSSLTLHFLSREDADEEKKGVEKEISSLKQTVQAKDSIILQKDKRIAELESAVQELTSDLKAEIDRGKFLTAKSKSSTHTRVLSEVPSIDTQKKASAVRLYEDLTNILVLGVKTERNEQSDKEDTVFQCLYTHQGEPRTITVSFQLRLYFDHRSDGSHETVKYTPNEFDKESPDFRERLAFLGETFTFEKRQLQVFYEQLREHVAGALEQEQDPSEDGKDIIDLRSEDELPK